MKARMQKFVVLFFIAMMALTRAGQAQQVRAELSQDFAAVGQPVRLNISVTGGRGAQVPQQLNIDGIDARFVGKSEQMQWQMGKGGVNSSVTSMYSYIIVPLRQGDFTIPAISIVVAGKTLTTSPLKLSVSGGRGGSIPVLPAIPVPQRQKSQQSAPPPAAQGIPRSARAAQQDESKIAFGDLIIPKKTVFVGEVVPVELRFYFDASYPVRLPDRPTFAGDGFTVMRFSKPIEKQQDVGGRTYNLVIFQTALTAAKAGTLEISPATMESQIQLPGRSGIDDFFGGFFGNMLSTGDIRQTTVSTPPAKLEVKPLPKDGQPENFSGAIGQFSLQASAAPKQAPAGDPISLNVTVSGRGNFDAMGAPVLLEADGWRTYPPGEKFEASQSDPIGFNGEKRFEYMIVAREDRSKTPIAELSFFDPAIEKYVTVRSNAIAVTAKGGKIDASPVAAASPTPQPQTTPSPAEPVQTEDQLVSNYSPAAFSSFAYNRTFLIVNGALAAAWSAALLFGLGRIAATSSFAKESAFRRNNRALLRKMEDSQCGPDQFFQSAEQFVHVCLSTNGTNSDLNELLERSKVSDQSKAAVRTILNRYDEWKYSPTEEPHRLEASERQQLVAQLKSFDHELRK
jgi:oxygen tolerance protein BatD